MTNEILRKFTGPTLRELVEKGDLETTRKLILISWFVMICLGFAVGVSFERFGWIWTL